MWLLYLLWRWLFYQQLPCLNAVSIPRDLVGMSHPVLKHRPLAVRKNEIELEL